MSKGLGRIERAILAAVAAEPDNAFTVLDLVDRIWPDRDLPGLVRARSPNCRTRIGRRRSTGSR